MAQFLIAFVDDVPIAASVDLMYKDVIYGWYNGMNRDYSSYPANEPIVWHLLKYGAENGFRYFDFGEAGKPDEEYGVRGFKAKFRGELVNFGRNKYIASPFLMIFCEVAFKGPRKVFFS